MAASPRSLAHDDVTHLRPCFPPLSEFPDSPSVYSHTYQSPEPDVLPHTPSFSHAYEHYSDFDDEAASTIHSVQDDSDVDDFTDDASHRISLRGPRIRFHSRAPWETDSVIQHSEESGNSPRSPTFSSKLRGKAARADTLIRTLARRSSVTGRPSIDSVRSKISATSSFEITAGNYSSSRGALYDLAKESMSTSSLSSSATSASANQQSLPHTTNLVKHAHSFIQSHTSLPRTVVSLDGIPGTLEAAPALPSTSDTSCVGQERCTSPSVAPSAQEPQSPDEFIHPYANPDLVLSYARSPETIPSHHSISGDISSSDSNSTVADSTSIRSAAFSVASAETSTSLASRDLPYGNTRVNGKEISSPISVLRQSSTSYVDRNTRFLSLHPPPPGFDVSHTSNPRSPTVALITLQEAQARERIRGSTVHTTSVRPKEPFPNIPEDHTEEPDSADVPPRTRARSTSAGARHKPVPLSPTRVEEFNISPPTSTVPGRSLKHKKSGFMRLFTGRSEGEKEKSLPPIPPPSDAHAKQSLQIHVTAKSSMPTLSRVQNPPFSPTLRPSAASNPALACANSGPSVGNGLKEKRPSPRRRQPPPLSIVTKASDHNPSSAVTGPSSSRGLKFVPAASLTIPQSAPPGDTDFPGLKLRPISTSFSSHFADMVAPTVGDPRRDVHTPSSAASSSAALSPFTPVSMRRSDDTSATAADVPGEEHLTIKELQEQFVSAKMAWQQQIWELRGQIRDLTAELDVLRAAENQEYCEFCGRGKPQRHHVSLLDEQQPKRVGVVNRPRARTGDMARFVNGN